MTFYKLKEVVTQPPVLALLDIYPPFTIERNAFVSAIGAILMQQDRSIAFFSQALKGRTLGIFTTRRNCLPLF